MSAQVFQCGGVLVYQLLCGGKDGAIALDNPLAASMRNYCYLIVNSLDRTAVALDAAWDVPGIYRLAEELGVRIRGCIYTHRHFDHVGGDVDPSVFGRAVPRLSGAREVEAAGGEIWAGTADAEEIGDVCGLSNKVKPLADGDAIDCGDLVLHALSTPGHTPGSICIYAAPASLSPRAALGRSPLRETLHKAEGGLLLTGDTLFVGSCGATHFRGGDQAQMFKSLARLSTLDPSVVVCPGHAYSDPFSTIGKERAQNSAMLGGIGSTPKPPPLPPCVACGGRSGSSCGPRGFKIGRKVRIAALTSEAGQALNGQDAVVQFFAEEKERYAVRLLASSAEKLIRPENLERAAHFVDGADGAEGGAEAASGAATS